MPVTGRIGVIVYLTVGDGAPDLEIFAPKVTTLNGQQVPVLSVHNSGTAQVSGTSGAAIQTPVLRVVCANQCTG